MYLHLSQKKESTTKTLRKVAVIVFASLLVISPITYNRDLVGSYQVLGQVVTPPDPTPTPVTPPDPTPTPTPVPTPVTPPDPTPTPLPSPTPVTPPDPTPSPNSAPVIRTTKLKNGSLNTFYTANIVTTDVDENDILYVYILNLPPVIEVSSCTQQIRLGIVTKTCTISGVPTSQGLYTVTVLVNDGTDWAVKDLTLKIR